MSSCVIILSYPDTDNKLKILSECISKAKKLNLPILLFSNMDINQDYISEVDEFIYTGENELFSASDFLTKEQITLARNTTKYRNHLMFDNNIITYIPISYGSEKNYYWALTKLYKKSFEHCLNKGYSNFMLLQELHLNDDDIELSKLYLNEVISNNLDGMFAVEPNMGDNHLSDFVFFGKTSWWNDVFQSMNINEFYNLTFPNWSVEEYYYKKAKSFIGKIKFKIRTKLEDWEKQYYWDFPPLWTRDDIDCETRETFNLFFPNLKQDNLSNNTETPTFNINKSLVVSLRPIENQYQLFVWNKSISENDRNINVTISINSEENNTFIFNLNPNHWVLRDITDNISGKKVFIDYSYYMDNKLIEGSYIYQI
jgi:hypothetical protein